MFMKEPFLSVSGLTKVFGKLAANDGVTLQAKEGEIHAVLGENGAGKSTLMKMLYGVYQPDGGEIAIEGRTIRLTSPAKAREEGIRMVFQDFRLIPAMTVLENVALSITGKERFSPKRLRRKILELSGVYGFQLDPDIEVWRLDLGQRQRVEILKVLLGDKAKLIIFDEPTSVLTPHEAEAFIAMLQRLKNDGYAILLITHKIGEVLSCADRVTVLREGKVTYSVPREEGLNESDLVGRMLRSGEVIPAIRRPSAYEKAKENPQDSEKRIILQEANITDDHGRIILEQVSFEIKPGQILGIAGIAGNGQRELSETLVGLRTPESGTLTVEGENITGMTPAAFLAKGIGFVSEDPMRDTVIPGFSILEHMALVGLPPLTKGANLHWEAIREAFNDASEIRELSVAESNRRVDRLSGGNIQRMELARALLSKPRFLVASYPSRGLDIGTTAVIQSLLRRLADEGTSILLISEELEELFRLSDSIAVLHDGKLIGPIPVQEIDIPQVGVMMLKGEVA
jgi:ABC-type uncharacterized transport system ATPase subunit